MRGSRPRKLDAVTPALLARVARSLIVEGESLHLVRRWPWTGIAAAAGRIDFDVFGETPDPEAWRYRASLYGPDGTTTVMRPAASRVPYPVQ